MKRHKFTKWNKERFSIYASAALIVCVCVVSGIYAGSQSPSKKQIIDLESVGDDSSAYSADGEEQAAVDDENVQASVQEEETVPVATNGQTAIPSDAREGMEQAKELTETGDALAADLTGDAEVAEIVEINEEDFSVPTMAGSNSSQEAVLHFNGEDGLSWPVIGNVVMNYSMDERTYFATLNQYCYYPAVAISAEEGAPVSAAAEGKVSKVGINEEIGQYVIMDLGDGYQATYGQLANLTVEQGDKVSRSQVIGYVAAPTKYYSLEGTNIYFKLEKDGESLDPVGYFK
ncbi:MAG: M23 family metallopeptidase [Lachnospiraceae bacterium]|nr:M23 family metallopeptidase [Lachnospiraceae bacterium]